MDDYIIRKRKTGYSIARTVSADVLKIKDPQSKGISYTASALDFKGLVKAINDICLTNLRKMEQLTDSVAIGSYLFAPKFYHFNCGRDKKVLALLDANRVYEEFFREIETQMSSNCRRKRVLQEIQEDVRKGI